MQQTSKPQEATDRREAPRADIGGRYSMVLDPCDGRDRVVCAVMDFSVTGVRLEMPKDMPLPARVQILIGDLSHSARIAWRKGTILGIDFIDEHHSIY